MDIIEPGQVRVCYANRQTIENDSSGSYVTFSFIIVLESSGKFAAGGYPIWNVHVSDPECVPMPYRNRAPADWLVMQSPIDDT